MAAPQTFVLSSVDATGTGTGIVITLSGEPRGGASAGPALAQIAWLGVVEEAQHLHELADDLATAIGVDDGPASSHSISSRSLPVLPEPAQGWFGRPGLVGYRPATADVPAGTAWSTQFVTGRVDADAGRIAIFSADDRAGLELHTEIEAVAGGALRIRHTVTNTAAGTYLLDELDVVVPVGDRVGEVLDTTGRWALERAPQRHAVTDGTWLREGRTGRPGFDAPTVVIAGTPGFGFGHGDVWGVHLAWSGNARHFLERRPSGLVTMGAGELLLAAEVELGRGESYSTPWVHVGAARNGLDALAAQAHDYLRSLPAHPARPVPVVSNVWEAVYFDHDLGRLTQLAELAAGLGVERFVLDDGWFGSRRDDTAGLGDWVVSPEVWPGGLHPLIDRVTGLGMQFGLWFEPEMVNADSELYREHPDWILHVEGHRLRTLRHQLVLDLSRGEVRQYLFDRISVLLDANAVSYVKWDHNRELVDAGSSARSYTAAVHAQTLGYYDLLDRLRAAHPTVEWESCASGGARIDLGVLQRTQRVWTSDMTDALARQTIQRWTSQLVAPEYLGAHVSTSDNHQTGRRFSLDFRAATAFFGSFGIEWDVSTATDAERARLAEWIAAYKQHRGLLHAGRMVRVDLGTDGALVHGVVAVDRSEAVFCCVQLDEQVPDPPAIRCPGLDPGRRYVARRLMAPRAPASGSAAPAVDLESHWGDVWRGDEMTLSGAVLADVGLPGAPRRPLSALLVHLRAV